MPSLELTDEQALRLWEQLPEEQKKRVMAHAVQSNSVPSKARRQAGSGKDAVRYIAPDFYELAEGFEDYQCTAFGHPYFSLVHLEQSSAQ